MNQLISLLGGETVKNIDLQATQRSRWSVSAFCLVVRKNEQHLVMKTITIHSFLTHQSRC